MKNNVQDVVEVLQHNGTLAANASISGSALCHGYQRLAGLFRSDASTQTGSGLHIRQSANFGANWDYTTASDAIAASTITACSVSILGNAIQVIIRNGATEASSLRTAFYLYPI